MQISMCIEMIDLGPFDKQLNKYRLLSDMSPDEKVMSENKHVLQM